MTGSEMGGLMLGFCKYFCAFFGAIFGVCALVASGWLQLLLVVIAVVLLVTALILFSKIDKHEKAAYEARLRDEAERRHRDPFYSALCQLGEELKTAGLTDFSTGQRSQSAGDGSANSSSYLVVTTKVEERDAAGKPVTIKGGMTVALLQSKIPSNIGGYPVRLEFST